MKAAQLFAHWKDQEAWLLRSVKRHARNSIRRGNANDIHQLRVSSRRLRQLVRLDAGSFGRKASRQLREWARATATATDRLRDLDVALDWLRLQPGADTILPRVNRLRQRALRAAQRTLAPFPNGLRLRLSVPAADSVRVRRLLRRFRRVTQRLRERSLHDAARFSRYDEERRHGFRRVLRRWRYLRELELTPKRQLKDELLTRLTALQRILGERQNLRLAACILGEIPGKPDAERLAAKARSEARRLAGQMRPHLEWLKGLTTGSIGNSD